MINDKITEEVEKGDPYDQIKEAERRGVLSDVLLDALQDISDESWEDFCRQWKDYWSTYLINSKSEE